METQEIRIEENGLKVVFEVRENGMVELKQFSTVGKPDRNREPRDEQASYSITEIQLTGKGSRNMQCIGRASLCKPYIGKNREGSEINHSYKIRVWCGT